MVVGVDADSRDDVWPIACRCADAAYRFRHSGQMAPIHMLALGYCQGEWILRLDDDEFMERGFADILSELLATSTHTHYYLPRKWVVSLDPPLYLHAAPWYPDHALRLFRNDPTLVWKPPATTPAIESSGWARSTIAVPSCTMNQFGAPTPGAPRRSKLTVTTVARVSLRNLR